MSSKPPRIQLLLTIIVIFVCSSIGPLSTANAIEAFPDSASRSAVVAQVVAPQVDDVSPQSFTSRSATTTKTTKPNLRSEASGEGSASATSDTLATVLPGENGFGQVSYNSNAQASRGASDSSSAVVESQAAYRVRIRKAKREAELKYPHLRLQNLISL